MTDLTPKYEELQSIYDISNEFFELFLGLHLGLDKQVAVFLQQRRQFVAAQAATVEHGNRIAALIGQMLDDDKRE